MVFEDLKPSDIMTREAFENAIVINSAIGGSTNAPIHLNAVARHLGVSLNNDDWQAVGHKIPLLVNLQPAGEYLGEDYHRAGGVPAVVAELMRHNLLPHPGAVTANGASMGDNCKGVYQNTDVIKTIDNPLKTDAGFINLKGNLFDSAIMKTSVISSEFSGRYLSNPDDPNAFEGTAYVFDGPEDFHKKIDDESLKMDAHSILVMRGRPKGLSGRGRSGEYASACLSYQTGGERAAMHWRWPAIRHIRLAFYFKCLARGSRWRRAGIAAFR